MEFSIDRLARLARLQLSRKEEEQLKNDMERIMTYVGQLREVDTEGIAEIMHAASEINVLRADVISEKKEEENAETVAILRDAFPERVAGYTRVPLVINKHST